MHGLHKNLDWLSRYLFDVSGVPFGPPIAMIDIAREPQRWTEVRASVVTAVGVPTTLDITTPAQRHRCYVWGSLTASPTFGAGGDMGLTYITNGLAYPLATFQDQVQNPLYVFGGQFQDQSNNVWFPGIKPLIVHSRDTMRFDIVLNAIATVSFRGLCIDLPEYAPFPPVFTV